VTLIITVIALQIYTHFSCTQINFTGICVFFANLDFSASCVVQAIGTLKLQNAQKKAAHKTGKVGD
jgi:hypothetical protein